MSITLFYLVASILSILAIRGLASPNTARQGNWLGMLGMAIAVGATFYFFTINNPLWIISAIALGGIIGTLSGEKVKMTALPQMIAAFNGLGGLASVFIALGEICVGGNSFFTSSLGAIIGSIAFSGSMVAFAKLQGLISSKQIRYPLQHSLNLVLFLLIIGLTAYFVISGNLLYFYILTGLSIILGFLLVLPIGGADMPIIISILNSYSGWAGVGVGFAAGNILLIVVGSIVGASGSILSYVMTKAMNSSLLKVMFGDFGGNNAGSTAAISSDRHAQSGSPEDAAFIMENAEKIIIVPGYGMAAAHAQHAVKEMAELLRQKYDAEVKFAIHPVAGRMPGHMNVLLAEANVSYDDVFELDEINREFATADVAYVIGANDITNPSARTDPSSPLYGMPVLDVEKAKTVFFVKRSLGAGYSGVENPLFFENNTIMLYGDAKKVTEEIVSVLEKG